MTLTCIPAAFPLHLFAATTPCIPCFLAAPFLLSFPASLLGYSASAPAFLSHTPHPDAVPQTPFSRDRRQTRLPLHPPLPRRQPGNPPHPQTPFLRPHTPHPGAAPPITLLITPPITPPAPARVIQANRLFFDMPPLPAPHSPRNRTVPREPRRPETAPPGTTPAIAGTIQANPHPPGNTVPP